MGVKGGLGNLIYLVDLYFECVISLSPGLDPPLQTMWVEKWSFPPCLGANEEPKELERPRPKVIPLLSRR